MIDVDPRNGGNATLEAVVKELEKLPPTLKALTGGGGRRYICAYPDRNRDTPLHLDDVAEVLHQKLAWPEDEENAKLWREQWRSAFTLRHLEVVSTSKELAIRLADLARAIRDRIQTGLKIETENGPLTALLKAFQQALKRGPLCQICWVGTC